MKDPTYMELMIQLSSLEAQRCHHIDEIADLKRRLETTEARLMQSEAETTNIRVCAMKDKQEFTRKLKLLQDVARVAIQINCVRPARLMTDTLGMAHEGGALESEEK